MDRRKFLTAASAISITAIAGCSGEPDSQDSTGGGDSSSSEESTDAEGSTESQSDSSGSDDSSYQVRISYDGDWSGSIGGDGSSRSVDGSGTETFDIDGDPFIVSANAQKQDDSSDVLTVEILQGGEVIASQTTSASYGVAQVTSEDDVSSGDGSSQSESESESESASTYEVQVNYDGEWQGSISAGGSSRSVQGSGSETIEVDGSPDIISANAQKQDDGSGELTIQILEDGEVVEETSTSAEYGVAQVTFSNF